MGAVKLAAETLVRMDHDDLCAVLTEYLCGSSYDAFSNLRVGRVTPNDIAGGFDLELGPKSRTAPDAAEAA